MLYLKLIAISLFIISCAPAQQTEDITPTKDVLVKNTTKDLQDEIINEVIEPIKGKTIIQNGYELTIGESTKAEFENIDTDSITHLLKEVECIEDKLINIKSLHEVDLKLSNGDYFTLKKDIKDEQFFGYTFIHYDDKLNIYVLWENWLEAGHPIMVNAKSGKVTIIYGRLFRSNTNQTLTANIGKDIDSGWTPNGIQVFEKINNTYVQLFEFDPARVLNEKWGPVDFKWKNDKTIYVECVTDEHKGGDLTLYKVVRFVKLD
jgi:hypothetical protein